MSPYQSNLEPFSLVRNDALFRLQRAIGLIPPDGSGILRRAIAYGLFCWIPIVVWALMTGRMMSHDDPESLAGHYGIHVRCLIAIPLLVMAESNAHTIVPTCLAQFLRTGLVDEKLEPRFREMFAQDAAVHDQAMALRGTARWKLASSDADLSFPHIVGTFECALGVGISKEATPRLYQLVQRTIVDAGMATSAAKHKYNRTRPFVTYNETTCFPKDEPMLRADGSYPSGHTALSRATALVLVETAPDRQDALLARGRSYGESRLICNAHWQSDVLEGRFIAAATVASLHTVPEFLQDIVIAKKEVTAARKSGSQPTRDCTAEADALAQPIPGVL